MSDFNLRALSMKMCSAGFGAVGGVFQHDSGPERGAHEQSSRPVSSDLLSVQDEKPVAAPCPHSSRMTQRPPSCEVKPASPDLKHHHFCLGVIVFELI